MNFVKKPNVEKLRNSGFSLIELLVVVSIIVILAGITIGVMSQVNAKRDISTTSKNIGMVRTKLEAFYNEQGYYPVGQNATSACVYKALSGDPTGQGTDPTGTIYWPELNEDRNPALVTTFQGFRVILDGFGQSLRYRSANDTNGNPVQNVKNDGDFDLWSIGPDGEPSDINVSGLLNNEQTRDDIWQ
jgi:prepilin-type N-terminal cleavage/methylation domain-containing protein